METKPIESLKPEMILFSESARLMVSVKGVLENGFTFRVMNGMWDGRLVDGALTPDRRPEMKIDTSFEEVTSITGEDISIWHMHGHAGVAALIDPEDALAPSSSGTEGLAASLQDRVDTVAEERGWEEAELNDKLVGFIGHKGLGEEFVSYLGAPPEPDCEFEEPDEEITF